jgi:hypothetical protein
MLLFPCSTRYKLIRALYPIAVDTQLSKLTNSQSRTFDHTYSLLSPFCLSVSIPPPHAPVPESIECFSEGQAFSRSYYLSPRPPPPPLLPTDSRLDRRHIGRLRKRGNLLTGEGGNGRSQIRIVRPKKAWSSIYHWILSVLSSSPCEEVKTGIRMRWLLSSLRRY